ncbi:MAG: methyl-accepting chemotaxis protein [Betaproteobacteria bacterium]
MLVLILFALQTIHSSLLEDRKAHIKLISKLANNEIEIYLAQEQSGTLTRDEAQAKARKAISGLREGENFVFVRDIEGRILVHADQRREGQIDLGSKGADGRTTFQTYLDALKDTNHALVEIKTKRPSGSSDVSKINGLNKIQDWGWIVGFGEYTDDIEKDYWHNALIFVLLGASVFLIIIGIAVVVSRHIQRSLYSIQQAVSRIEGDLDFTIHAEVIGKDEISEVSSSINRLLDRLRSSLGAIAQSTNRVAESSAQLALTSNQVAITSKQQSDSASNMAASVEEMTVSITHVRDRSSETHTLAVQSGQYALQGAKVITQTVEDINKIAESVKLASERIRELEANSAQISSIVSVIKEVADQTNLLALNAAIEAARAGEQGRGFSVVADEVRKLAERTSASTQEISSMVDAIRNVSKEAVDSMTLAVDQVTEGVRRASDASEAMNKIGEGSHQTVEMVDEISSAIREQSQASNAIAINVESIAQMAEESSAAANNSAESARHLDNLAREMREVVSAYRL